jgi:hypothetical protein
MIFSSELFLFSLQTEEKRGGAEANGCGSGHSGYDVPTDVSFGREKVQSESGRRESERRMGLRQRCGG